MEANGWSDHPNVKAAANVLSGVDVWLYQNCYPAPRGPQQFPADGTTRAVVDGYPRLRRDHRYSAVEVCSAVYYLSEIVHGRILGLPWDHVWDAFIVSTLADSADDWQRVVNAWEDVGVSVRTVSLNPGGCRV